MLPLSYTAVQNQSYGLSLGAIFNDTARLQNRQHQVEEDERGPFLLGMKHLSEGLQAVSGSGLRKFMSLATTHRLAGGKDA